MRELIKSIDVRKYLEYIKYEISDFEKATILYNTELNIKQRRGKLLELSEHTNDERTKQQIEERITYEDECLKRFFDNSKQAYVYTVNVLEDDERYNCGYFRKYDVAKTYGKKFGKPFEIRKYEIVEDELLVKKSDGFWNPNLFPEKAFCDYNEYNDFCVGEISFDEHGSMEHFYFYEIDDEGKKVDEFNIERFENRFVAIPHPFNQGDIVRLVTDGGIGIVETKQEEWQQLLKQVKNGLYVDWSDASITVSFLTKAGFEHNHVSPLILEKVKEKELGKNGKLLKGASDLITGKGSLDFFLREYENYKVGDR